MLKFGVLVQVRVQVLFEVLVTVRAHVCEIGARVLFGRCCFGCC